MLKFSFLDSQSDIHPLAAIFLIQNSIFNSIKDSNDEMHQLILSFIPILDKSQMSQLTLSLKKREHIRTIVEKCHLPKRFDSNMIDSFNLTIKDQNIFPESLIVSISFACVIWYCDTTSRNPKDFEDLISFLSGLLDNNQKMNFIINYAFKKLLKGAVSSLTFKWHPTLFRVVFSHVFINTSLEKKVYKELISFFRIVVDYNHQDSMNEMMKLITTLVKEDRKIINWDEIQLTVFLFMPFINSLEEQALSFISLLSYKTNSTSLVDTFVLLPSLLLNSLDFDSDEHQFFSPVAKFQDINVLALPLTFSNSNFFTNGFATPTVSFFEEVQNQNKSLLSRNTVLAVEKIADCICKASMMYRQEFFTTFGKMFTILKNSSRYIQTCTAFVLLMEYTIQSVPIELFLSILNETVLFRPEYNIYAINGIDKMINYLRNRVFQMVIENSPLSIASFFEKTSCYPLLLTEHLNRLLFLKPDLLYDSLLDEKNVKIFIQSALHLYCLENSDAFVNADKIISQKDRKSMVETYDIKTARNDNFLFLINICKKSDIFSYFDFAHGFLWFMLEQDVSYYVLFFLRKGISDFGKKENRDISPTVDFIQRILLKTISFINNEQKQQQQQQQTLFNNLTISLADALQDSLLNNPTIFKSFESVFLLFFDILDALPSSSLLESCFRMLEIYNQIEKWKPLNPFHSRILLKSIQSIEGTKISDSTFKHLYNMLTLTTNIGNFNKFHIKKPSILPLLLSVFITANKTIDFFEQLKNLCDYSVFNSAACHDGGMDTILLDYLINRKSKNQKEMNNEFVVVNYCGVDFSLSFTLEELKTIIFPFLFNIFKVKSDNSVYTKLSKIIGENIDEISLLSSEHLIEAVTQMKSFPVPRFRIGTFKPTLKFVNIPEFFFVQAKFIVKFDVELDAESIISSCTSLTLFSISDDNNENSNEISLLTDQMSLLLCIKINGISQLKYVVRVMPTIGLNTYEFHFTTTDKSFSLCAFINDEELNYFQNLQMPHFASEKVSVSIGGFKKTLGKDWLNVELGSLSHFAIATTQNINIFENSKTSNENSIVNTSTNIYSQFNDHFYLEGMKYNLFCIMSNIDDRNNFSLYSEGKSGIKAFINFANLESRHNLLFYLTKGDFINSLCQSFFSNLTDAFYPNYIKIIFDILTQIIPITQFPLNYLNIDSILHYLNLKIELLDSELFFCISTIFDEISKTQNNNKYSIRWFELLIVNFWLWSKMRPNDFKQVLYYYCHQLIFSHPNYFQRISYFSLFLNQYYLMFCMKEDGITHEYSVSDLTIFRKEYTNEDIEACREMFEVFLNRVITLRVEKTDIETLFAHLFASSSIKTIHTMLHLLASVPTSILRQSLNIENNLSMLHNFFSQKYKDRLNIEIIEQVLILIHKLAADQIHQHFLAAAHELKLLYNNDNDKNKFDIIDFFKSISHYVDFYPNISIFICILALNWYKSNDLDKTDRDNINSLVCSILLLICNKKDSASLFEFCGFWYIWPILIAYTLESSLRRSISFFLSKMLIYSPNPISEMDKIVDICNLITSTYYPKVNLAFEFMKELCGIEISLFGNVDLGCESIDTQVIRHSILRCFYLIFLHFTKNPINKNIYVSKQIIESEICQKENNGVFDDLLIDTNDKIESTPITTPQEFEQLICADLTKYKMMFRVILNQKGEWNDRDKASFVLSLIQKCKTESFDSKIETIYKIILYFLNREKIQIDHAVVIQSSFGSIFEPLTEVYGNQFGSNISTFSKLFHKLMESMYDLVFNSKIVNSKDYINKSHLFLQEEVSRAALSSEITVTSPSILRKSNILASDFCPHLIKRTRPKEIIPLVQKVKPLIEINCIRVKINSIKKYTFSLYKDSFSLSGIKNIPLDEITMILARKRNKSSQISNFGSESGSKENSKEKDKDKEKTTAIEIFTTDGRTFLLDFLKVESSHVIRYFLEVPLPNIRYIQKAASASPEVFNIPEVTQKWSQGLISNFDYLMMLNVYSGRSFNDENVYPIFPSILSDFENYTMIRDIAHHFRFNHPLVLKRNLMETLMENQVIKPEFFFSGRIVMDPSMYLQMRPSSRSLSLPMSEAAYFPYLPKASSHDEITADSSTNLISNKNEQEDATSCYSIDVSEDIEDDAVKLPHWASSPFEFVYKHRLLLESKSVNEYLGDWIFDVFGPRMKSQFGHRQLFTNIKHPSRSIRPLFDIKKTEQHFKIKNAKIIEMTTVSHGPIEFKFLILLNNGALISMVINTTNFANPALKVEERAVTNNIYGRFVMSSFEGNSLVLSRDDQKVVNLKENLVDPSNLSNLANFNYPNNLSRNMSVMPSKFHLATDTNFFFALKSGAAFCPDETTIATVKFYSSVFSYQNAASGSGNSGSSGNHSGSSQSAQSGLDFRYGFNLIYSNEPSTSSEIHDRSKLKIVWRTTEKIISVEVSWRFKTVVFATVDGFLHFGSIRTGSEVNAVNLKKFLGGKTEGNQVRFITITRNMGFVVVTLLDRFLIFTINGDFIKHFCLFSSLPSKLKGSEKVDSIILPKITEKVVRIFAINKRGIDFIAYQNEIFEIKVFEAFYPQNVSKICNAGCIALCVEYDPATDGYLIIRESGRVSLIPSCV